MNKLDSNQAELEKLTVELELEQSGESKEAYLARQRKAAQEAAEAAEAQKQQEKEHWEIQHALAKADQPYFDDEQRDIVNLTSPRVDLTSPRQSPTPTGAPTVPPTPVNVLTPAVTPQQQQAPHQQPRPKTPEQQQPRPETAEQQQTTPVLPPADNSSSSSDPSSDGMNRTVIHTPPTTIADTKTSEATSQEHINSGPASVAQSLNDSIEDFNVPTPAGHTSVEVSDVVRLEDLVKRADAILKEKASKKEEQLNLRQALVNPRQVGIDLALKKQETELSEAQQARRRQRIPSVEPGTPVEKDGGSQSSSAPVSPTTPRTIAQFERTMFPFPPAATSVVTSANNSPPKSTVALTTGTLTISFPTTTPSSVPSGGVPPTTTTTPSSVPPAGVSPFPATSTTTTGTGTFTTTTTTVGSIPPTQTATDTSPTHGGKRRTVVQPVFLYLCPAAGCPAFFQEYSDIVTHCNDKHLEDCVWLLKSVKSEQREIRMSVKEYERKCKEEIEEDAYNFTLEQQLENSENSSSSEED